MALRLATRMGSQTARGFCSKPVPLGMGGSAATEMTSSVKSVFGNATRFNFRQFFEEKYFWEKANLGPFFLLLFFTPTIYRSMKDVYWTRQLRKLDAEEIISDRYEWLRLSGIRDEVEASLLQQAAGIKPLVLGPETPP